MHHETISPDKKQPAENSEITKDLCQVQDFMQTDTAFTPLSSTIQQVMEILRSASINSVLVVCKNVLDDNVQLVGHISIKDVFRQLFPGLSRKDIIVLNQVLHEPIDKVMCRSQKAVDSAANIKDVLTVIIQDFNQMIGVQRDGKLVGCIRGRDLLRPIKKVGEDSFSWLQSVEQDLPTTAKVSEIMAKHILCLSPQDEIFKAMEVFMATDTHHIAILDEQGKLVRILFPLDVLEYILELIESKELTEFEKKGLILDRTIGSLLHKDFISITENAGLAEAIAKMVENNVFCLAVTDSQQRYYGNLSCADILRWIKKRL